MEGPRRSRATARPLTVPGQPSAGWGAIVRHRVPAAAAKGVAGHAPPHRVPLQRNPPTLGRTARCKLPHGSTPLTWDTSGQKKRRGQGRDPGHTGGRLRPANAAPPPVNGATDRDTSGAVLIVLHATSRGRAGARHRGHHERGSTVSHRAPPRQEPHAAPPGTSPSGRP